MFEVFFPKKKIYFHDFIFVWSLSNQMDHVIRMLLFFVVVEERERGKSFLFVCWNYCFWLVDWLVLGSWLNVFASRLISFEWIFQNDDFDWQWWWKTIQRNKKTKQKTAKVFVVRVFHSLEIFNNKIFFTFFIYCIIWK